MGLSYLNQNFNDGFFVTVILGAVILLLTIWKIKSFAKVPPGPWGLPILGYTPFLSQEPYKDFKQISKKYGNLFSLQLGSRFVVVLNNYDVIRRAFKTNACDGRQQGKDTELFDNGIIVADGEIWRKQRRFLQSSLKDFGFGTSQMEEFVKDEILVNTEHLYASKGKLYDVSLIAENIASNVIAYFIFGQRFSVNNQELKKAIDSIRDAVAEVNFMAAFSSFPEILKYVPDWLTGLQVLVDQKAKIYSFVNKIIDEHEKTFHSNNIRDLIDVYLEKISGNPDDKSLYNENLLRQNTMNLFVAGAHTTNNMITWFIRILAAHPVIQRKMQTELDAIVGKERLPLLKDQPNLPYTEAVFLETYRHVSLVPLTLYHRVTEDIIIDGYHIPKNTCALANIWNVHNTEAIWTEPDKFNPQRFLDENGKLIAKLVENVIPFSIGKRNCVGKSIARMEVFLAITILFQKFCFTLPDNEIWNRADYFIPNKCCPKTSVYATPR